MKILIHGKNLELTGALKEYTEAKIEKATHHYKDIVKEADIHLSICLLYTSPSPRDDR